MALEWEQEWQTLSGTVENIVYCNEANGYTVLELSSEGELYTAVGELSSIHVEIGRAHV